MSKSKIPLLLIADCLYGDGRGGSEIQFLRTYGISSQIGVTPFVVFLRDREVHHKINWKSSPLTLDLSSLASPNLIKSLIRVTRFIKDNRIKILQSLFDDASIFSCLLKWQNPHVKFICSQRNLGYSRGAVKRYIFRQVYRNADRIIVNSGGIAEVLEYDYEVRPEKIELIDNMHDVERFKQIRRSKRNSVETVATRPLIGVVLANLRPIKGIEDLLAGVALLPDEMDVRILIAGSGTEREKYEQMIVRLELSDKVELLGYVPEVDNLLARADFAILPSRSEGGSNALVEYLLAGLPTIATNVGGNRDFLNSGEYGILIDPNQPVSICEGIKTIVRDYSLWRSAAAKGRRAAASRFCTARVATKYKALYNNLA